MRLNRIIIIGFLLAILAIGSVSAAEDSNSTLSNADAQDELHQSGEAENLGDGTEIEIDEIFVPGMDDYIRVGLQEDAVGSLKVTINGSVASLEKRSDGDDGCYIDVKSPNSGSPIQISGDEEEDWLISLDRLPLGKYNIVIDYTDNSKPGYNANAQKTVTVGNPDNEIIVNNVYVYKSIYSKIMIPNSLNELRVLINNNNYPITNGYIDLSGLDLGTYSIVITGRGKVLVNKTFTIGGIITAPVSFTYRSPAEISLVLPEDAVGNVTVIKEGDVVCNQQLVNGHFHYSLTDLVCGAYLFDVTYDGWDYSVDRLYQMISVNPIVSIPSEMRVGENRYVTFDFGAGCQGSVSIEADLLYYASARLVGGKASISLANLDDGAIDLYVLFIGDDGFRFDGLYTVDVLEIPPKIIGLKNIKMTYGDGTSCRLVVYGSNGKYAEIEEDFEIIIGKTSYDLEVGKNGVVKFKINVAPGKYKIRAIYDDVSVQSILIVKHLLKLKKVKVKKSANKITLKAMLKKGMKGKKIVFKFNGKKFVAKTNKKGVAKVTIKKSLLKKLKVGKRIRYQATYLKDTVKYAVKVKK